MNAINSNIESETIVFNGNEFFEQFGIEQVDESFDLSQSADKVKSIIEVCDNMGEFYDALNLQRITYGALNEFLISNGLKTKKNVRDFFQTWDTSLAIDSEVLDLLYKKLQSFYAIKRRVSAQSKTQFVHTIEGDAVHSHSKNLVGYCHHKIHKGYLTDKILSEHKCLGKNCPYLEKFENKPYWTKRVEIKELKRQRKEERQKELEEEKLMVEYKEAAKSYVYLHDYTIKITKVIRNVNGGYLVYFDGDKSAKEDKYYDIAWYLEDCFHKQFAMYKVANIVSINPLSQNFRKVYAY